MSTTTNSLRQHIIEQVQRLDEHHLKALQAYLRVLELSLAPSPVSTTTDPASPTASSGTTTPEEDAEFERLLDELHHARQP